MKRRDFIKFSCCIGLYPCTAFSQWPGSNAESSRTIAPIGQGCSLAQGKLSELGSSVKAWIDSADSNSNLILSDNNRAQFGRALGRISKTLNVRPSFAFYDDSGDGPNGNAYASPDTNPNLNGTWGSVLFGENLFSHQMSNYNDGGVSIIAIAAHEFAHILQFQRNIRDVLLQGQSTVKRMELQADFLAGYHLGKRKTENSLLKLWATGETVKKIGDTDFYSPQHHGTPEERLVFSEAGFKMGKEGSDLEQAFNESFNMALAS